VIERPLYARSAFVADAAKHSHGQIHT
jgi:hypothetical protein